MDTVRTRIMHAPSYTVDKTAEGFVFHAEGTWTIETVPAIDTTLRAETPNWRDREIRVDVSGVDRMDTIGAMVLYRVLTDCGSRTDLSAFSGADEQQTALLDQARRNAQPCEIEPPRTPSIIDVLARVGRAAEYVYYEAADVIGFHGVFVSKLWRALTRPAKFRSAAFVHHIEVDGLNAVPIVLLLSFLVGAVVAFLGASILRQFGAEFLVIELIGFAVLREFGVLLTAIIIAGRSGSAFTAQIGSMKMREEIDAMRVIGIDPMEALVLPRVLALMVAMPMLTFLADVAGLIGGGVVAWFALGVSPPLFLSRLSEATDISQFYVGLIKAPFFALAISLIGCLQGMKVAGTAESVGRRTTTSVVEAIFLVIILDAFFAMFFLEIGW